MPLHQRPSISASGSVEAGLFNLTAQYWPDWQCSPLLTKRQMWHFCPQLVLSGTPCCIVLCCLILKFCRVHLFLEKLCKKVLYIPPCITFPTPTPRPQKGLQSRIQSSSLSMSECQRASTQLNLFYHSPEPFSCRILLQCIASEVVAQVE